MAKRILALAFITTMLNAQVAVSHADGAAKPVTPQSYDELSGKVVYGRDNRLDLFQVSDNRWRELSRSTAALVKRANVRPTIGGVDEYSLRGKDYGREYSLCQDEPFREQMALAFCSGFYVGGDVMVTAGHCIRTAQDCEDTVFVFDYAITVPGVNPTTALAENVYRCMSVVHTEAAGGGVDYAVVRLERSVTGRTPLRMRQGGQANAGDELVVIGHPAGLPTKVAGDAYVRSVNDSFLVASLDTYGGNSGSAVFNAGSGEVEGILVRGETDFSWRGQCRVSNVCTQEGCRGEDVTLSKHPLSVLRRMQQ